MPRSRSRNGRRIRTRSRRERRGVKRGARREPGGAPRDAPQGERTLGRPAFGRRTLGRRTHGRRNTGDARTGDATIGPTHHRRQNSDRDPPPVMVGEGGPSTTSSRANWQGMDGAPSRTRDGGTAGLVSVARGHARCRRTHRRRTHDRRTACDASWAAPAARSALWYSRSSPISVGAISAAFGPGRTPHRRVAPASGTAQCRAVPGPGLGNEGWRRGDLRAARHPTTVRNKVPATVPTTTMPS